MRRVHYPELFIRVNRYGTWDTAAGPASASLADALDRLGGMDGTDLAERNIAVRSDDIWTFLHTHVISLTRSCP